MSGRVHLFAAALAVVGAGSAAQAGTPRGEFILKFDLLSPGGVTCTVDAPGGQVRTTRDPFGKPVIRIFGHPEDATILCTAADGTRWRATANRTAPYTPGGPTWGTVAYRAGGTAAMTVVEMGKRIEYQFKTFVRVD